MPGSPKKRARKEKAATQGETIVIGRLSPQPRKMGAPKGSGDTYDPVIAKRVLRLIADGTSPDAAAKANGLTSHWTLHSWRERHHDFDQGYARAREQSADALAYQAIEIVDSSQGLDSAGVAAANNRARQRQWAASKMQPRVYGDKLDLTATVGVIQLTDTQIDAKLDALLAMVAKAKNG